MALVLQPTKARFLGKIKTARALVFWGKSEEKTKEKKSKSKRNGGWDARLLLWILLFKFDHVLRDLLILFIDFFSEHAVLLFVGLLDLLHLLLSGVQQLVQVLVLSCQVCVFRELLSKLSFCLLQLALLVSDRRFVLLVGPLHLLLLGQYAADQIFGPLV